MLWQGLKTACCHSSMHIVHFLKNDDQWQIHSLVKIGVDESTVFLTIAEHIA